MITGSELRAARKRQHLTQEDLAPLLGVSTRTVGNWERGTYIHPSHWDDIRRILPSLDKKNNSPRTGDPNIDQTARRFLEIQTTETTGDGVDLDLGEQSHLHAQIAHNLDAILDFAQDAATLGASRERIQALTGAILNVLLDTGTLNLITKAADDSYTQQFMLRCANITATAEHSHREALEDERYDHEEA